MEAEILTGSTATPAPAPSETPPIAETPAESAAPSAAPAAPQACKHCGLEGKHVEPVEPVTCGTCGREHGTTAEVLDRASGKLVPRRIIVTHSLEGVGREGGRKPDGQWTNPTGRWTPDPICTLCVADLKCRTYDAQKATPKGQRKPRWPNFWALHLAIEEAEKLNAQDAGRQAQRERDREVQPRFDREVEARGEGFRKAVLFRLRQNRSAGLSVALDAELAVLAPLDAFVARYGTWARGVVFAHMRDARCSLEAAIEAKAAAIEAEGKAQLRRQELLARGYGYAGRLDGTPDRNGGRDGQRREAQPQREPKLGERGGPRREKGDRRRRHEANDGGPGARTAGGGYVTPDGDA